MKIELLSVININIGTMNILIGNDSNKISVVSDPGLLTDYEFKPFNHMCYNGKAYGVSIYIKSVKIVDVTNYLLYGSGSCYSVDPLSPICKNGYLDIGAHPGSRIYLNDDVMEDYKSASKKVKEELDETVKRMESEGKSVKIYD